MSHPSSCHDPECTLTYRQHLFGISIAPSAMPTRHPEVVATNIRERRWARDIPAFRRLHKEGHPPPLVDGAALRERQAETVYDVEQRPVSIDYSDPT